MNRTRLALGNRKINKIVKILLTAAIVLMANLSMAQPGDPDGPPPVPIDGMSVLLVAGGLLGAKKAYDLKKQNK